MEIIQGGVTAAKGFFAAGVYAGIKRKRKDMSLVYCTVPAVAAGTFTKNLVKAAPVKWDINLLQNKRKIQAIVINSGIANTCTGEEGEQNNEAMAMMAAKELQIAAQSVWTASTGIIGKQLPMDIVNKGIHLLAAELSDTREAGTLAAEAIKTTDTYTKECAVKLLIGDKVVIIGGMSKGTGMLHPDMATMIGVVTTDLAISQELLQETVSALVDESFHMISVDRETSTNDSFFVLASGLADNPIITEKDDAYQIFALGLREIMIRLTKMMASDGEGATKLFEAEVVGAKNKEQAAALSKAIISSNVVKTAIFGNNANWGRILCAMGYSGMDFDPDIVDLYLQSSEGKIKLVENGIAADYQEELASKILSADEVRTVADLKLGKERAVAWGCDLTYDYIKITASYRAGIAPQINKEVYPACASLRSGGLP